MIFFYKVPATYKKNLNIERRQCVPEIIDPKQNQLVNIKIYVTKITG